MKIPILCLQTLLNKEISLLNQYRERLLIATFIKVTKKMRRRIKSFIYKDPGPPPPVFEARR